MNETIFWKIVESAKKYVESFGLADDYFYERQAEAIINILKDYSDEDIYTFEEVFLVYDS